MELLLNLAWLLMALPAYWLWRASRSASPCRPTSLQCLLALTCVLVILFPVISATDDLCAMRNEMEESPAGKRCICQAHGDRHASAKWASPPALPSTTLAFANDTEDANFVPTPRLTLPASPLIARGSRAPPAAFFL